MSEKMFGFLNVYKPQNITSHDVVAILRKITKVKQIGHTGTLDPFAQGVLPICIGKATRLIEYLDDEKEYLAEISFGKSTDTYDIDGKVVFESGLKITQKDVENGLEAFKGEILQTPPIYSALKVKGKKLYEYARNGEDVKIEPRKVFIEKIELKDFDEVNQKAQVLIKCSKGTYIRSIAHDLGQNLKVGAYLSQLIRTQAGKFFIDKAIVLDEIKTIEDVQKNLINPPQMLNFEQVVITEDEHKKIVMGQVIDNKNNSQEDNFLILVYNNNISAIGIVNNNQIKAKKVFL
ncbi:MAG: tRNA pseudouridine(55) synthase TruB [bacterium]